MSDAMLVYFAHYERYPYAAGMSAGLILQGIAYLCASLKPYNTTQFWLMYSKSL